MSTHSKKRKKKDRSSFWYYGPVRLAFWAMTMSHDIRVDNEAIKGLKQPFVVLGNHQGRWDFVYAYKALFPHKLRIVATRYFLYHPIIGLLMRKTGAIGKSQFASDPSAVREILRTVKRGGNILMYPSGRISLFGEDAKPYRGTYELLKTLKAPVVMLRVDGSYRTGPRYNTKIKKSGRVDAHTSILFTPEDLQNLPEDEALARLDAAFCHDDFASPNQGKYKSKNLIKELDDLLYMCPACKADFTMQTEGKGTIKCTKCGFAASMDSRYRLTGENSFAAPATISEWGRLIRAEERRRADEDPHYAIRAEMALYEHVKRSEQLSRVGTVQAVFDARGFHLQGSRGGAPFERHYTCEEYPAIHFLDKVYMIVPDSEAVLCVSPPTAAQVTQWAVVSEMFSDKGAEKMCLLES